MNLHEALLALVREPIPEVQVFDAGVPDGHTDPPLPQRYAVYWPTGGLAVAGNVAHTSTGRHVEFQINCVAPDRSMAHWMSDQVRDHIVDQRPIVAGLHCGLIVHSLSVPARRDEAVLARRVVVAVDRYELLTERL